MAGISPGGGSHVPPSRTITDLASEQQLPLPRACAASPVAAPAAGAGFSPLSLPNPGDVRQAPPRTPAPPCACGWHRAPAAQRASSWGARCQPRLGSILVSGVSWGLLCLILGVEPEGVVPTRQRHVPPRSSSIFLRTQRRARSERWGAAPCGRADYAASHAAGKVSGPSLL